MNANNLAHLGPAKDGKPMPENKRAGKFSGMRTGITWVWRRLGSIQLTVWLCLLLVADLGLGYLFLHRNTPVFAPLNQVGLIAWSQTYGLYNLTCTAWFFLLLVLLSLFCLNTFVCTTDKVVQLIRNRVLYSPKRLFFKSGPHLMHYALLVILIGYLASYMFAQTLDSRTLIPETSLALPETRAKVTFTSLDPTYYQGELPAFQDRVIDPRAKLVLSAPGARKEAVLSYNKPVFFQGYGIFLKDFAPTTKSSGMGLQTRIDITLRNDPGVQLYLMGMALFLIGLSIYIGDWILIKRR